ncbi:MAG: hypothetical protein QHH04_07005 [Methanolinea sp.]|jgi:menaquinone-dependent protoporphyrinogen oxidase|nr:hypothetical protein [Methanolinea sp.]
MKNQVLVLPVFPGFHLQIHAVTMFAGKFDPREHGILVRSFGKVMKIPAGDFRDWDAIPAWARGLPGKMGF